MFLTRRAHTHRTDGCALRHGWAVQALHVLRWQGAVVALGMRSVRRTKNPELAKMDKDKIIEKMKSEGIMEELIQTLPK